MPRAERETTADLWEELVGTTGSKRSTYASPIEQGIDDEDAPIYPGLALSEGRMDPGRLPAVRSRAVEEARN